MLSYILCSRRLFHCEYATSVADVELVGSSTEHRRFGDTTWMSLVGQRWTNDALSATAFSFMNHCCTVYAAVAVIIHFLVLVFRFSHILFINRAGLVSW